MDAVNVDLDEMRARVDATHSIITSRQRVEVGKCPSQGGSNAEMVHCLVVSSIFTIYTIYTYSVWWFQTWLL
jgi:hypothetical protein